MDLDTKDKGRRVELVGCDDLFTKLKPGDKGTYDSKSTVDLGEHNTMIQHFIDWDSGSNLILIQEFGPRAKTYDKFKFID